MIYNSTNESKNHHDWEPISIAPYAFAVFSCIWTIVANSTILICFYRERKKIWTTFTRFACSMASSDLVVGFSLLPFIIKDSTDGKLHDIGCLLSLFFMLTTNLISLLHVLGICIHRNVQMKKLDRSNNANQKEGSKATLCFIVVSWLFPPVFHAIPYGIWGKLYGKDVLCSADAIFQTDFKKVVLFTSFMYGSIQWATNIVYAMAICRLRRRFAQYKQSAGVAPILIKREKRAMWTMGITLLLFNVFTFQTTIAGFFVGGKVRISRDIRYVVSTAFAMNSGLNPIVYAYRIPVIRKALVNIILDIRRSSCFCRNETNGQVSHV